MTQKATPGKNREISHSEMKSLAITHVGLWQGMMIGRRPLRGEMLTKTTPSSKVCLSQVILEGRGEPAWGLSIRTLPALRSNQVPCLWSGEMPDLGVLTPALLKNALYLDKALSPYNFKKRYCGVRNLGTWSNVVLLGSGPQIISFLCKELNSNNHWGFDLWTFQNLCFKSSKHAPRTITRGFVTSENEGDWPGVAPPASASPERLCSVWGELWMSNGDGWGEWGFEPASFETSFWLLRPWEVA